MMNFRLIGAAALSLVLATPAMAMHHGYHHGKLPVQDAMKYNSGSTYGAYNFHPRDEFLPDHEERSDFPGYDPVPPVANGG
jgi:hypothetical protein